jgi:probable blue pigment (indigoidine) exporter
VGTALGVAFAHEVFGTAQALGVLLVLGGVILGQRVVRPSTAVAAPVVHTAERALTMSR